MYPYIRLIRILFNAKRKDPLNMDDESVLKMRVFIGDIDMYPELNNGRHLTMMDMGRKNPFPALVRAGITSRQGLIPVKKVLDVMGMSKWDPCMPAWVKAWSDAEDLRPWDNERQGP